MCIGARLFLACGSSAPVRVEHEGGTAAWLVGTLAVPSMQGNRLRLLQELGPYQSVGFFIFIYFIFYLFIF